MIADLDDECRDAVEHAVQIAELVVAGQMAELEAATAIAGLGTIDCLEYLQAGFDFVDSMGALWALVYQWEMFAGESARQDTLQKIRTAIEEFLVEAKGGTA
jgi:hypothetical protein